MKRPFLSIIIPVFNEEKRLHNLEKVIAYIQRINRSVEILVVDDGSNDRTKEILKTYAKKIPIRVLTLRQNAGKGHAIKKGMLAASGRWRMFMDIDLSVPLETIEVFLEKMDGSADVLIGTRRHAHSKITQQQDWLRQRMGHGFTILTNFLLGTAISDFTCGFKVFEEQWAKKLFGISKTERWGFDAEILFLAHKFGAKIQELPVAWQHNELSKVSFPGDVFRTIAELLQIRRNHWQ